MAFDLLRLAVRFVAVCIPAQQDRLFGASRNLATFLGKNHDRNVTGSPHPTYLSLCQKTLPQSTA
jgi:hypothetical protein